MMYLIAQTWLFLGIAALIGVWMKGWAGQAVTVALAAIIATLFLAGLQRLAHLRTS